MEVKSALLPSGVIEFARTVYAADYENSDTSIKTVEKYLNTVTEAEGKDKEYMLQYLSAACDVAFGLKRTYDKKDERLEKLYFEREDAIKTAREYLKDELKAVDGIKNIILQRISPAGVIYVPLRVAVTSMDLPGYLQWIPEAVGGVAFLAANVKTRVWAREEKKQIRKKYKRKMNKIAKDHLEAKIGLEDFIDEKNRERFIRAEDKLLDAYEKCYAVDLRDILDDETSAEKYRSNDGEKLRRHDKSNTIL